MKTFKITLAVSQINSNTITADTKRTIEVNAENLSSAKDIAKKQYKEMMKEENPSRYDFCEKTKNGFMGVDTVYIFDNN